MTIMEHCELGKDVGSLDEFSDDRLSRRISAITTDAIVDGTTLNNEHSTLQMRSAINSNELYGYTRSRHRHSYLNATHPEEEQGEKPGTASQAYPLAEASFMGQLPHGSYRRDHASTSSVEYGQLVPFREADHGREVTYNFRKSNLQIGHRPTMVVNVLNERPNRRPKQKKKYTITNSKKKIDDVNIDILSAHLGKHWTDLARKLGFHSGDIDRLEYDNRSYGLKEIIVRMLTEWREKKDDGASLCVIADALISLKLYNIAQELRD